jgi:hypothetical protein
LFGFSLRSILGDISIELSGDEVQCRKLASEALMDCHRIDQGKVFYDISNLSLVSPRVKNWPSETRDAPLDTRGVYSKLLVLAVVSALFGGLHLFAWTACFPSPMQRLLWNISVLTVVALGPVLLVWELLTGIAESSNVVG